MYFYTSLYQKSRNALLKNYNLYQLLVISMVAALFVLYPDITWLPFELEGLARPEWMHHVYFFIFRYIFFAAMIFILMKINLQKFNSSTFKQRLVYSTLIAIACYGIYGAISFLIFNRVRHFGSLVLFQFFVVSILSALSGYIDSLYSEQRKKEQEIEVLKVTNLQSRYDALTNQINPHFFFNSLNGLTSLIRKNDNEMTLNYVNKLSDVFRYILQSDKKGLITLAEELAFLIFDYIEVEVPIIFTTAYDEYAIEAFKVNSIDYLLKPVKTTELQRALTKFSKWSPVDIVAYLSKVSQLTGSKRYKDKILIPVKDKLLPIEVNQVSYFYTSDKNTSICLRDGTQYTYFNTLDQIFSSLNPADFYRANKQYIVARNDVKNITIWFDSRLLLTLDTEVPEPVYISKNKAAEFKAWMVNG